MNNRQQYLKKYRLEHKEKYREYQRKYRKNHLSTYEKLQQENKELKEDISFCLHSIKQEMEMSTDSRTRNEMTSCYDILKRWSN